MYYKCLCPGCFYSCRSRSEREKNGPVDCCPVCVLVKGARTLDGFAGAQDFAECGRPGCIVLSPERKEAF